MLEDAIDRLNGLDEKLDGPRVARALAEDLPGRDHRTGLLADRTDGLVNDLRDDLIDLIVQPRRLTRAGRPSAAAERRARHGRLSFDEGYLVGRIGLDTHRVPLRWSSVRHTVRLGTLRSLVLHPRLAATYASADRLVALVHDLTEETRGVPADQAAQFAGLGLLTAVAEWTVIVNDPRSPSPLLLATC